MKPKKALIPLLVLLVLGLLAKFTFFRKAEFLYVGTIEATKIDLSPRLSSVITRFDVKEGQKVRKDQVLAQLDEQEFKIAAETAEGDFVRAKRLYASGSISQEAYEHLRAKRDETAMRYSWTTIKSPVNGTVLNTYKEAGEWVNPGAKVLTLADLSEVWAIIYVEQRELLKLSLGMKVEGIIPEFGPELGPQPGTKPGSDSRPDPKGRKFEGTITKINDEAEFTPKNVQTYSERTRLIYGVKVTFPNPDGLLKPGMSIEVRLPR